MDTSSAPHFKPFFMREPIINMRFNSKEDRHQKGIKAPSDGLGHGSQHYRDTVPGHRVAKVDFEPKNIFKKGLCFGLLLLVYLDIILPCRPFIRNTNTILTEFQILTLFPK